MQAASTKEPKLAHDQLLSNILDAHSAKEGKLLPILHAIQDQLGYIPENLITPLATAINQTSAEVYGVISFYKHFRLQPCGDVHIEFCQAEACQARGATQFEQEATEWLHTHFPNASYEPVYCLGLCAQGPAAMINQQVHARLTLDKLKAKVEALQAQLEGVARCKA